MKLLSRRFSAFLGDLSRRRVIRRAAYYVAGIWTVVVVMATLIPLGLDPTIARWIVAAAVAGFPVALVLGWYFDLTPSGIRLTPRGPSLNALLSDAERISVAVLPLEDLSEGGDAGRLADGVVEEVLNALGQIEGVQVAASTSSASYRGPGPGAGRGRPGGGVGVGGGGPHPPPPHADDPQACGCEAHCEAGQQAGAAQGHRQEGHKAGGAQGRNQEVLDQEGRDQEGHGQEDHDQEGVGQEGRDQGRP
jgi:hypothetical protein